MERYDYHKAILEDIRLWLENEGGDFKAEHADENGIWVTDDNKYEIADELYDILWTEDSVTGNGSGSYTFSSWEASENLCHNWDLLAEALGEFGCTNDIIKQGPKAADVTIRCYLLSEGIINALNEILN